MNNLSDIKLIDYISLSLVVSFLLFHNIIFVIIGIIISLYSINKNEMIKLINYMRKNNIETKNILFEKNQDIKAIESRLGKSNIELVEIIEETGFIPSKE